MRILTDKDNPDAKQLKEMLWESEKKYGFLFENSKDAIYITRSNGMFVDVNPAAADLLGYAREEILKLNAKTLYANPGDQKIFQAEIKKNRLVKEFEVKLRKNDWTVIDCVLSVTVRTAVNGSIKGYQGIIRDITEYKRAEKNLKASQKYAQNLIDSSLDMIIAVDKQRRITEFNQAAEEIFGYKREEVLGKHINMLYANVEQGRKVHKITVEKGRHIQEISNQRKDGEVFPAILASSTLVNIDGEVIGIMGVSRDITTRKQTELEREKALDEAQQANKVKTLFLANMSHEIRTPLNSILGFTNLIERSAKEKISVEEQEFFDTIRESGKRLMRTVQEVLDMSQVKAQTLPISIKKFDLAELVEKAVKPLIPKANLKNLELNINTTSCAFILADENYVVQSIVNLVENAIKYTEKGRIDIDLEEKTDTLELKIKDTGIGIGADYIKDIFQVFTQESTGYTKKYQGVGLGLALVKNYLELCDATVVVKSKKNVGSTFTVTFMKMKERRKQKRMEKSIEEFTTLEREVSKYKPHVLVVEDDQSSQRLISFFLRDYYDLEFAVSVLEAKEKLAGNKLELVLLDLSLLGDENGLSLARYMRKSKKWNKIPIIATTAHAFTEDRDKCLEAGCNDYLAKPIIREKLIEKMKQQLDLT